LTLNINSRHFINRIENDIVQLTKTLSIEHAIPIEEAKLMARKIVQIRLNELLTDQEKSGIEKIKDTTIEIIKNPIDIRGDHLHAITKPIYELLKTMELL